VARRHRLPAAAGVPMDTRPPPNELPLRMRRRLFALASLAAVSLPALCAAAETDPKPRRSAARPTALPEDKALADQCAAAAAGYATQARILEAAGQDTGPLAAMGNWLYFNAIDLSDKAFAQRQLAKHLGELSALNDAVNRAAAASDGAALKAAGDALTARINQRLAEGERLFAQYEKVFNTVVQKADGSFTIQAR
jgi:hypothetical protein